MRLLFLLIALAVASAHGVHATEWQTRIPAQSSVPEPAYDAVLLDGGRFLLAGDELVRLMDSGGQEVLRSPRPLFGDASHAMGLADGSIFFVPDTTSTGGSQFSAPDADTFCQFESRPWGVLRHLNSDTSGRFAHGAKPVRPGMFAVYAGADAWRVAYFSADCQRRDVKLIEVDENPPSLRYAPDANGAITLVNDHLGYHAFERVTVSENNRVVSFRISKLNIDGNLWTYRQDIPNATSSSSALRGAWSLEPTRDGGVLVFDGLHLIRLNASGAVAWSTPTGIAFKPDVFGSLEPAALLVELEAGVLLEFDETRLFFSPDGVLRASSMLSADGTFAPSRVLPSAGIYPLLTAQSDGVLRYSTGGEVTLSSVNNASVWTFDQNGVAQVSVAADATHLSELALSGGRFLQRNRVERSWSILDASTGARVAIADAVVGTQLAEVGLHVDGEVSYAFTSEAGGSAVVTKLAADGEQLWSAPIVDDAPLSDTAPWWVGEPRAVLATRGDRVCALFGVTRRRVACLDAASGAVVLPAFAIEPSVAKIWDILADSLRTELMHLGSDNSITILSAASRNGGSDTELRVLKYSADGAVLSSTTLDAPSLPPEGLQLAVDPTGEHILFARQSVTDYATWPPCGTRTTLERLRSDGSPERTYVVEGSAWFPRGLAADGRALLSGCLMTADRSRLLALAADGRELWRAQLPDSWYGYAPQAHALANGDWLLALQDHVVRLSGSDGRELWRQRFVWPQWWTLAAPRLIVREDRGFVVVDPSPRESKPVVLDLATGEPLGTWRLSGPAGTQVDRMHLPPLTALSGSGAAISLHAAVRGDGAVVSRQTIGRIDQPDDSLPGLSLRGLWHDEVTVGQGLVFDVGADGASLAGAWFTFADDTSRGIAADTTATQRWYVLQGSIESDAPAAELSIYAPEGGSFDSAPAANSPRVGRARLAAQSCDRLLMTYRFDEGELSGVAGTVSLRRTAGQGDCARAAAPSTTGTDGAWYRPATNGQGLFFQSIDADVSTLVGTWFAFDPEEHADDPLAQHWFTLLGAKTSDSSADEMLIYRTIGGAFDAFATANSHVVGRARFVVTDCGQAHLEYAFDDSPLAGVFAERSGAQQLTSLIGCVQR